MRYLLALAVVAACSGGDRSASIAARDTATAGSRGTDALVLRVPRRGGIPRVSTYSNLDSAVWTGGESAPALDRVLAFDDDAGLVAFVDSRGLPGRIDLRLGTLSVATRAKLHTLTSVDATHIYGLGPDGAVVRLAPEGDWVFKPPHPARDVFPLRDGSVLVLGGHGDSSALWRIRPPENRIVDSLSLTGVSGRGIQMGGRLYLVADREKLIGIATRVLQEGAGIDVGHPLAATAATPSGDRLYVAGDSSREVAVVDRYRDRVATRIELPGQPRDLRIDPLGRYLLVRSASSDTVWIIDVGTDRMIGAVRSTWRTDLPFVAADGLIGVGQGADVAFVDPVTGQERQRVDKGAQDFWFAFQWTGFRPRAAGLDRPVDFPGRDSIDTTVTRATPPRPPVETIAARPKILVDSAPRGFVVSFAALLSEPRARELAAQIKVRGQGARVVATDRDGTTIYRVLLGPYPTREDAERAGRESGQDYWVYQATP